MAPNLDRLKSQLLISGLQIKDNPLYQVINQLIDATRDLQSTVSGISGGGGGGATTIINQSDIIQGQLGLILDSIGEPEPSFFVPGMESLPLPLPVNMGGTGSTSFTTGSVIFSNGTILTEDNTNFFWDDTNNRLIMPTLVGGSAIGSVLNLIATSANGTLGVAGASIKIFAGNNGANEIARFFSESANDPAVLLMGTTDGASLGSGGNKIHVSSTVAGRSGNLNASTLDTASGTFTGGAEFGTLGCAAAEKRAGSIYGVLEAASSVTITGGLRFFTTNAGSITEKLRITAAGLITFQGATSSFPALKRSSAILQVRLADDSADAELQSLIISTNNAATFHTSRVALTDGAGVGAGTITNAPSAGNPTKWIGVDDNGTTRYVPTW